MGKSALKPCSFYIYMWLVSPISMVKITGNGLELLLTPSRRGLYVHLKCRGKDFILWNPRNSHSPEENTVQKDIYAFIPTRSSYLVLPNSSSSPSHTWKEWAFLTSLLHHFIYSSNNAGFFPNSFVSFIQLVLGHPWMLLNTLWVGLFLWILCESWGKSCYCSNILGFFCLFFCFLNGSLALSEQKTEVISPMLLNLSTPNSFLLMQKEILVDWLRKRLLIKQETGLWGSLDSGSNFCPSAVKKVLGCVHYKLRMIRS